MRSATTRALFGTLIIVLGLALTFALGSTSAQAMDPLLDKADTRLGQSQSFFYAYRPAPDGALYLSTDGQGWRDLSWDEVSEIRAVAANSAESDTIYVAAERDLFVTADGGESWQLASAQLDGAVRLVVPALPAEDMVYAVTEQGTLYKVTDVGQSAMRVTGANLPATVNALASNPANPNQLFAATTEGLWVSNTAGEQWEQVPSLPAVTAVQFDRDDSRLLYVTTPADGLLRSPDGGMTWQIANEGIAVAGDEPLAVTALVQDPEQPATLYLATTQTVYISEDGGVLWLPVAAIEATDVPLTTLHPIPGPEAGVRATTLAGLREFRLDADAALAQLASDDPETRLQGATTLSIAAVPTQADAILPYIHDEDGQLGYYAARALGRMGGATVTQEMVVLVEGDADPIVKHRALLALQLIADESTVPVLANAFADENLTRSAADALAAVGTDEAWEVLAAALNQPVESIQRQAVLATMEANSARAIEYLIPHLAHEDALVRANAAEALGWSNNVRAIEPLRPLLDDPNDAVRARTALALGILGDGTSLGRLTILSEEDASREVRKAAAQALIGLQGLPAPVAPIEGTAMPTPATVTDNVIPRLQAFVLVLTAVLAFFAFTGITPRRAQPLPA